MKIFLSIGAGPGMGYATAARFGREGFRVVLAARDKARVTTLADRLASEGIAAEAVSVDASNPDSVANLIAEVEGRIGQVDVMHYNAASMRKANLETQPLDTFNTDLAVNIGGALSATKVASEKMIARGKGAILLTGGGFGVQPSPDFLSLSIGKAGIRALAQGIFEDFRDKGVHVATVTVAGFVSPGTQAVEDVAEHFWQLYNQDRDAWTVETVYTPVSLA